MKNQTKITLLFALLAAILNITTALSSEPHEYHHDESPSSNQAKKDERESLSRFLDYWKKHKTTNDDQEKAMKHNEEHEKAEHEKAMKHEKEHEKAEHEKAKKHEKAEQEKAKKNEKKHEKAVKKHNEEIKKATKKHNEENKKAMKHNEDEYNYYHNGGGRMTCDKFPRVCHVRGSPGPDCCKKKCVDVRSDELNCGMCGNKCKFPEVCCKGKCVNMLRDRKNCGRCGNKCRRGSFCEYGMCSYA